MALFATDREAATKAGSGEVDVNVEALRLEAGEALQAVPVIGRPTSLLLDRLFLEVRVRRFPDVGRCNVTMRVNAFQSLNQCLFKRVDHHAFYMIFPARLRKAW
jgi:hypothetical protein